jgi:predicted lipoprotein with Yx(FWY)xxD motif
MTTLAAGALALAACANGGSGTGSSNAGGSSASGGSSAAAMSGGALATAKTSLGTVVVDGSGKTVYEFDSDKMGSDTSACTGQCAPLWPAVTTTASSPDVSGVSGTVGTVAASGGARQVTLNGHRLYTFSGDSKAGQVNGQGFMNIWWALSPAGEEVKGSAGAASSPSSAGGPSY